MRGPASFLFLCVLASTHAAAAQVSVAAPACEELDVAAIERALLVEIGDVAAAWSDLSSPVVLLGCAEGRVRIEITDPVTDKSVARIVPMPELDRERVLALAIAQLFLTSWLELLLDEPATPPGPGAEEAEARARDAVTVPDPEPEPEPEPEREPEPEPEPVQAALDAELSAEGGPRLREAGEHLVTAVAAFRASLLVDRTLLIGLRVGLEWGRAERARGAIDVLNVPVGVVAALRTPEVGPFFLEGAVTVSIVAVMLEGRPRAADVAGGSTRAVAAEGALELTPALRFGPVVVALPLAIGAMAFAPDGIVSGEPPVVTNGLFVSAALRVAILPTLW